MPTDVMIIDEDEILCTALGRMLSFQDYRVRVAHSGEEGLELCAQTRPSLILLDLSLPGTDGVETLRRLKKMDRPCRVVMITAYNSAPLVSEAMKLGADDYLTKPITMQELLILLPLVTLLYVTAILYARTLPTH